MAKNLDLQKVTLNLRAGDYARLGDLFPDLGAGPAIRQLVAQFVDRTEAAAKADLPAADVQL